MPVQDLTLIPSGTRVFVDTNVFDYHFRGRSVACTSFLNRVALGEIEAFVNTQVLSDLLHKMMLAEASSKGYCRFGAKFLRNWLSTNRQLAGTLTDYQNQFESTLALGLRVMRISTKLMVETRMERVTYGLMTGDSLHLGNMNRYAPVVRDIATHDGDFTHVFGLAVWRPMDVVP